MEIDVLHQQGKVPVTVFKIKGPVTDNEELERIASQAIDDGSRHIVLDLSEVPYMATSGLRAIHTIYDRLRQASPDSAEDPTGRGIAAGTYLSPHLKLVKPTPHVLEVLRAAGYDMFLEIHKDLNQAIASF